jgi:hypothetical protein
MGTLTYTWAALEKICIEKLISFLIVRRLLRPCLRLFLGPQGSRLLLIKIENPCLDNKLTLVWAIVTRFAWDCILAHWGQCHSYYKQKFLVWTVLTKLCLQITCVLNISLGLYLSPLGSSTLSQFLQKEMCYCQTLLHILCKVMVNVKIYFYFYETCWTIDLVLWQSLWGVLRVFIFHGHISSLQTLYCFLIYRLMKPQFWTVNWAHWSHYVNLLLFNFNRVLVHWFSGIIFLENSICILETNAWQHMVLELYA